MIPAYHACMLSKAIFMSGKFSLCFSRGHCLEWWSLVFQWLHLLNAECLGYTGFHGTSISLGCGSLSCTCSGSATSDLWMVLLPLFQVDSLDDECQEWKGAGRDKACVINIHSLRLAWSFSLELLHSSSVVSLHTWCIAFIMVYQILGTLKKQPWKHMKQIFLNVPWVVLSKAQNCQNQLSWKEQWRFNGKTAMVLSTLEAPSMEFRGTRLQCTTMHCYYILWLFAIYVQYVRNVSEVFMCIYIYMYRAYLFVCTRVKKNN